MTTDTVAKEAVHRDPAGWSVGGLTKGAGMIAPSMATMLSVLTTDAVVDAARPRRRPARGRPRELRPARHRRLDVHQRHRAAARLGCVRRRRPIAEAFTAAVTAVCRDLARQMQADAEGVTKRITVRVTGAATEDDAVTVARTVARDSLVKTALFGSDPNWGRVAAAVGYADAAVDPDRLDITINGVLLCRGGVVAGDRNDADLKGEDVLVEIALGLGDGTADILTTDLSHAYVEENSAYSS